MYVPVYQTLRHHSVHSALNDRSSIFFRNVRTCLPNFTASIIHSASKDRGTIFLRNVRTSLPNFTASIIHSALKDRGTIFLRNVRTSLPNFTASVIHSALKDRGTIFLRNVHVYQTQRRHVIHSALKDRGSIFLRNVRTCLPNLTASLHQRRQYSVRQRRETIKSSCLCCNASLPPRVMSQLIRNLLLTNHTSVSP
jgi:hypothetical protein